MKNVLRAILVLSAVALSSSLIAQQNQNIYIQSTSRVVMQGGDAEFREFVREVIKPMYAEAVESGHLDGWYMWRTRYRSNEESYSYVFASASTNLANLESTLVGGTTAAAARVHGMSERQFNDRAQQASTTVVRNELWVQRPISVLQAGAPARYAAVRYYNVLPGESQTVVRELTEFSSIWQKGRLDSGISAGWAYFTRSYPIDSSDSYDSAEIAYYDNFEQVMGAGIGQQIWNDVRDNNSEISDHQRILGESREAVKTELWELVEYVIAD
jgi:hypothetical protein